MINNYDKIYSEFLDIVAELHNAHIAFKTKATHESSLRIKRGIAALEDHLPRYRKEIKDFREAYKAEQKAEWAKHKNNLRAAEAARARRREERLKRKQQ